MLALMAASDNPGDDARAWLAEHVQASATRAQPAKPALSRKVRKPVSFQVVIMVLAGIMALVSHVMKGK